MSLTASIYMYIPTCIYMYIRTCTVIAKQSLVYTQLYIHVHVYMHVLMSTTIISNLLFLIRFKKNSNIGNLGRVSRGGSRNLGRGVL